MTTIRLILILVLITVFSLSAKAQNPPDYKLNRPLVKEQIDYLDSLIRQHAPEQHALNAMLRVNNAFNRMSKSMNAYFWMNRYIDLFPTREKALKNQLERIEKVALTQQPDSLNRPLYGQYAIDNKDTENGYVAFMKYISDDVNHGRWNKVVEHLKKFVPAYPSKKQHFEDLYQIVMKPDEGLWVNNLGSNINTAVSEWDPNPTSDGTKLYFSGNHRPGGMGGDDVWVSHLENGVWQKPKNLGRKVNGRNSETIDNISVDGNTLMLSGDFQGTFGNFDIYSIDKDGDDWGDLFHYPYPINTEYTDEGGNLTADRKAMLFTSDRPGGTGEFVPLYTINHGNSMGNMDIYISFSTDSGWSELVNLGPTVNTPYAERSPFLHPDGKTLYFSSDGHAGLGGLDVFKTVRLDDSWTNWTKPVNLGKEVNTILDDWGYKIGITGDSAIFSGFARTNGYGQWDLFSISLPDDAKPNPVAIVNGNITDSRGRAIAAEVVWEDLETGEKLGTTKSNRMTGHYFIALPVGKNYGYYVEKSGYYPSSNNIDLSKAKDGQNYKADIELTSLREMKESKNSIVANNIFFDFDSAKLRKESVAELNRLTAFINQNKVKSLKIVGHTDKAGTKEYNIDLSLRRAKAVKTYISEKLNGTEITTEGKGYSNPIDPDKSEKNRRVEIFVE